MTACNIIVSILHEKWDVLVYRLVIASASADLSVKAPPNGYLAYNSSAKTLLNNVKSLVSSAMQYRAMVFLMVS